MGMSWSWIKQAEEVGIFSQGGGRILDIGSSNLYSITAADARHFVQRFNGSPQSNLDEFAARMERGSGYDPVRGGLNEAFVGELFEEAGFGYDAVDIADGYKTTIIDFNKEQMPKKMTGAYDVVINCGTTEHILNQLNSFRNIHDAAKVGGYICHQLPAIGFLDHGYFCYTGRFFFDLAGYNDYEIVGFWFDGGVGQESVYSSVNSYGEYFPVLKTVIERGNTEEREKRLSGLGIPTVSINIFYRKKSDKPFMGTVETSASVGNIPATVTKGYETSGSPSEQSDAEVMRKFFNEDFYMLNNPAAGDYPAGAIQHFIDVGWKIDADPTPGFSTLGYLEANTDVAETGMNPFLHYIRHGIQEGRGWSKPRDS